MKRHLLVLHKRKLKCSKLLLSLHRVKYYRWGHNNFSHNKYLYKITANYFQYCGSYAPQAPYYKLTGELKKIRESDFYFILFQTCRKFGGNSLKQEIKLDGP